MARIAVLTAAAMLGARSARADWQCQCYVDAHSFDRWMSGSWALECNNHGGHDNCHNNVDSLHSPGAGAMTGWLVAESRFGGDWVYQHVQAYMPDNHEAAFHGPFEDGEWSNTCACDGISRNANECDGHPRAQWDNPDAAMYSGALEDHGDYFQQITPWFLFPFECNRGDQWISVFEVISEEDPACCDDGMGQIGWALPANEGVNDYWVFGEHTEHSNSTGSLGGYFAMNVRHRVGCMDVWIEPPDDGEPCSGVDPCLP